MASYITNTEELTSIANAIREKGGTSEQLEFPDGFTNAIANIETGGGGTSTGDAVKFIDYDGTLLYSYSAEDFAALTGLPENPSHSGLTAQGWNWTKAQIEAQLESTPEQTVWVGQKYITDDGKTRLYCRFHEGRLSPYLGLCPNGTVTVDWGDGSATDTLTGTSLTTTMRVQHTYAREGEYLITLTPAEGTTFAFEGADNGNIGSRILATSNSDKTYNSLVYLNSIYRIELGISISVSSSAFRSCLSLTSITIPDSVTSIGSNAFQNCYSLSSITIPDSVTSIDSGAFQYCYSLSSIIIPDGVTSIKGSTFQYCYSLTSITIPNRVTSIYINAFSNCYGIAQYHIMSTTPPTLSNINAFSSIPADCIIYVPYSEDHSILAAYKAATNWSTYASYMQEEPQ